MTRRITVVSGKGGTGKTSIAASFAVLAGETGKTVLADCDVDAANLALLLETETVEERPFYSSLTAIIDADACTGCGVCMELCRFGAIERREDGKYAVKPLFCEGCGVCADNCPAGAIRLLPNESGMLLASRTPHGMLYHAKLGVSHSNSGKLVTEVLKEAEHRAEEEKADLIVADGPPGIGCPVIAALSGTDTAVMVTEPTVSGLHDLERVHKLARSFGAKTGVVVNKADLNPETAVAMRRWCEREGAVFLGELPFDKKFVKAVLAGKTIVEFDEDGLGARVALIWDRVSRLSAP